MNTMFNALRGAGLASHEDVDRLVKEDAKKRAEEERKAREETEVKALAEYEAAMSKFPRQIAIEMVEWVEKTGRTIPPEIIALWHKINKKGGHKAVMREWAKWLAASQSL